MGRPAVFQQRDTGDVVEDTCATSTHMQTRKDECAHAALYSVPSPLLGCGTGMRFLSVKWGGREDEVTQPLLTLSL